VEARDRFRFALLAGTTIRAISLETLGLSITDVEIIPDFNGTPDGMFGWLIFASRKEAKLARSPRVAAKILAKVRAALVDAGFLQHSAGSFQIGFTSLPEIEAGGGRFGFFR
jgi:hypothetical protein